MRFEPTLLAILDISGYTAFISQRATTLVHAEAIGAPRYVLMTDQYRELPGATAPALEPAIEQPDGFDPQQVWIARPAQAAGLKASDTPFMQ